MSTVTGSSATRLLVLGVVRISQPVHGYDVRRELLEWRVDTWAHVAPGSIYHQLRALVRDGLLEVTGVEQQGGRPARTRYQLTPAGEARFFELLRAALSTVEASGMLLMAGLPFFPLLARDEVVELLERRAAVLDEVVAGGGPFGEVDPDTPEHVAEIFALTTARLRADAGWARVLVERLRAGRYELADECDS